MVIKCSLPSGEDVRIDWCGPSPVLEDLLGFVKAQFPKGKVSIENKLKVVLYLNDTAEACISDIHSTLRQILEHSRGGSPKYRVILINGTVPSEDQFDWTLEELGFQESDDLEKTSVVIRAAVKMRSTAYEN